MVSRVYKKLLKLNRKTKKKKMIQLEIVQTMWRDISPKKYAHEEIFNIINH